MPLFLILPVLYYAPIQIVVIFLSLQTEFFPDSENIMQIATTCAQIVAGLFGITITGYVFFLSRLDALTIANPSIAFIIEQIKERLQHMIYAITSQVSIAIVFNIMLMNYRHPGNQTPTFIYRLLFNEFQAFIIGSITFIMFYCIFVLETNNLTKEVKRFKNRISDNSQQEGDVLEFMAVYGQIESYCRSLLPSDIIRQLQEAGQNSLLNIVDLLTGKELLNEAHLSDLHNLCRYHGCMLYCTPSTVTQEMCDLAQHILNNLQPESATKAEENSEIQ